MTRGLSAITVALGSQLGCDATFGVRAATGAYLLNFESHSIPDRIAFAFLQIYDNGFTWIGPGWILRLYLNAAEYAQIVKSPLRFHHVAFSQRSF